MGKLSHMSGLTLPDIQIILDRNLSVKGLWQERVMPTLSMHPQLAAYKLTTKKKNIV